MDTWAEEVWKYKTRSTGRQFRPGMLSWNYWIGSGYILKASPNGRNENRFPLKRHLPLERSGYIRAYGKQQLVGKVLGGKGREGEDYQTTPTICPTAPATP